jgi:hypothetical protein
VTVAGVFLGGPRIASVTAAGLPCAVISSTDTTVQCVVAGPIPSVAVPAPVTGPVEITLVGGCAAESPGSLTLPPAGPQAPSITGVNPPSGQLAGLTVVTISGARFGSVASELVSVTLVPLDGSAALVCDLAGPGARGWVSVSMLECTTPPLASAPLTSPRHAVAVTTVGGGVSPNSVGGATFLSVVGLDAFAFEPVTVTSVVPSTGPLAGGTVVTVRGTSLESLAGSTSVTLSGPPLSASVPGLLSSCALVPGLGSTDGRMIVCVTAAVPVPGTTTVVVATARGVSSLANAFTYVSAVSTVLTVDAAVIDGVTSEWGEEDTATVALRLLGGGGTGPGAPVTVSLSIDLPSEARIASPASGTVVLASAADLVLVSIVGVDDLDSDDGDVVYHLIGAVTSTGFGAANGFAPVPLINRGLKPVLLGLDPIISPLVGTDMTLVGANFEPGSIVFVDGIRVANMSISGAGSSSNATGAGNSTLRASLRDLLQQRDPEVHHLRQQQQQQQQSVARFRSPRIANVGYKHVEFVDPSNLTVVRESWVYYTDSCPNPGDWGTGLSCRPCPTGAICPGGERIMPMQGYWAPNEGSDFVVKCTVSEACPGCTGMQPRECYAQALCTFPYQEYACGTCAEGFYSNPGGLCESCPVPEMFYTMIVVNTMIWIIVAVCVGAIEERETLSHVTALVLVLQEVGGIGQGVSSTLPRWSYAMYEWIYLASGDVSFLKPDCLGRVKLELEFMISIAYSFGLVVPVVAAVLIARAFSLRRHRKHGDDVVEMRRAHFDARLVRAFTVWVTLIYFTVTQRCFQVMSCLSFDSGADKRLTTDRNYVCYGTGHIAAHVVAGVLICAITVGWPVFNVIRMRSRSDDVLYDDPAYTNRFDLLYEPFKSTRRLRYSFLLDFVAFTAIALSSTLLVEHPRTQYLVAGGTFTLVIAFLIGFRPYRRMWENALVACVMVANLLASTVIFLSHTLDVDRTALLTYALVAVVGIVLCTHLGIAVYAVFIARAAPGGAHGDTRKRGGAGKGDDVDAVTALFSDDPAAALVLAMGDGYAAAAGEVFGEALEEDADGAGAGGAAAEGGDSWLPFGLFSGRASQQQRKNAIPLELLRAPGAAADAAAETTAAADPDALRLEVMPAGFVPLFHMTTPRLGTHRHEPSVAATLLAMVGLGDLAPPSVPPHWAELGASGASSRVDVTEAVGAEFEALTGRRVKSVHLNADAAKWALYAAEVARLRTVYADEARAVPRFDLATQGTAIARRMALMEDVAETALWGTNPMGLAPAREAGPMGTALYAQERAPGGAATAVLCRVLVGCPYAAVRPVPESRAPPCRFGHAAAGAAANDDAGSGGGCGHAVYDSAMSVARAHDPRSFLGSTDPRSVAVYDKHRVFPEWFVQFAGEGDDE